jgi:DNA-binding GntR family transcriptional regulator
MVEFERNRGVRILETSVHDLEEILVLRILLEVPATHRAAQRIDAAGLEELRQEMDAMVEASEEGDEPTLMQHDRRFHELINTASGNTRLTEYVDSLRDLILTRGVSTVDNTRSLSEIVAEHEVIVAALASGDADAAASAMKRHLVNTASLLLEQEGGRSPSLSLGWEDLVAGGKTAN